jgi:hypothetical protein
MTIDPRVADQPIDKLETLLTPGMIKALRQCGAKTIGDAHTALTSGRFRRVPGMGAQREIALMRAIAAKERMGRLVRAAIAELDRGIELRDFAGVSRPGITDPIDWDREWGANNRLREAHHLAQHAPAMMGALLFYSRWGVESPETDDRIREDGGDWARAVLAAIDKKD